MLALLLLLGCFQQGTCTTQVKVVDHEEITPLNTSGADMVASVSGARQAPLIYEHFLDLPPTWLDLEVTWAGGETRFVDGMADGDAACPDRLEVDALLSLVTEDLALDEVFDVVLVATGSQEVHLEQVLTPDELTSPWIDDGEPVQRIVIHAGWDDQDEGMGWIEHEAEYTILEEDGSDWVETEVYTVATWIEGDDLPEWGED